MKEKARVTLSLGTKLTKYRGHVSYLAYKPLFLRLTSLIKLEIAISVLSTGNDSSLKQILTGENHL
jgi:hypothetical protein